MDAAALTVADPVRAARAGASGSARAPASRARRRLALAAALPAFLALSTSMFAHVLSLSPTRGTTCACSDFSFFSWFFEWPLVAISHGTNPLFSSAMFHPQGINLLSNTSVTAWTFVMLPVTSALGPIASLNIALIAAPVLSALSAMWLAQRWVRSQAAAFVAGALYGFSPLVLFQEAGGHLMVTSLFVPPLVVACLDELFVRRRRPAVGVGVGLGLLVALQFFVSTEVLVMLVVAVAVSAVVVGVGAALVDHRAALAAVRGAMPGLVTALIVAGVLLAWPAWYALAGPEHLAGAVWPSATPAQASLRSFAVVVPGDALWWVPHWGRFMRPTYLGPPLLATMLLGLAWLRREARMWVAVTCTAAVAGLALGARYAFGAWHYLQHLPILHNVMNERFSGLMFLPAGLALALVLDRLTRLRAGSLAAAAVAAACVVPFAVNAANALPYSASKVWEPTWYAEAAPHLPAGQVVLGFPFFNTSADLLAVQALHGMHYSIAGGTGPEWINARQGAEEPGYVVLKRVASSAELAVLPASATPSEAAAVRSALRGWGVTDVVVPEDVGPNTSVVARPPAQVASWLATVLGPPSVVDAAWVWHLTG